MVWKFENSKLLVALSDKKAKAGEFNELCEQIETIEKHVNLLTKTEEIIVKIALPYSENAFPLNRGKAVPSDILQALIEKGVSIVASSASAEIIIEVLLDTEKKAPIIYTHDALGFANINEKTCFLWNKPFGALSAAQASSNYATPAVTAPKGSKQQWRRILLDFVATSSPKALALALSVAAPIAHMLKEEQVLPEVPFFALIGESSSGKTTTTFLRAFQEQNLVNIALLYGSYLSNDIPAGLHTINNFK